MRGYFFIFVAGLGALFGGTAGHAAELRLILHNSTAEWGEALRGHMLYQGYSDPGGIDYSAWQEDFYVLTGFSEISKNTEGDIMRRESLRIYPRRADIKTIPSLIHGGGVSSPLAIHLLPPRPEGKALDLQVMHKPKAVYKTGEQITIRYRLSSGDKRIKILLDAPLLPNISAPEPFVQREEHANGVNYTLGWSLFVSQPGDYRIELPPVRYVLFGSERRKFYLPLLDLQVQAIPAYIPATIPVGETLFNSRLDNRRWRVTVQSRALLPAGLPQLESALATLAGAGSSNLMVNSYSEQRMNGFFSVIEYIVPLPRWSNGAVAPWVALQYFDPATARLQRLRHFLPAVWNIPRAALWVLIPLLMAMLLVLFSLLYRRYRQWQKRRAFHLAVKQTQTAIELRRLLLQNSHRQTLSQWALAQGTETAKAFATQLNAACYAAQAQADMEALRHGALASFKG